MEEFDKKDYTADAVARINHKNRLHFMNKSNRDRAFLLIKNAGLNARKTASRGQSIHPEYVEDYTGMIETGFGNSMYRTNFKVLYNIELI